MSSITNIFQSLDSRDSVQITTSDGYEITGSVDYVYGDEEVVELEIVAPNVTHLPLDGKIIIVYGKKRLGNWDITCVQEGKPQPNVDERDLPMETLGTLVDIKKKR